MSRGSETRQRRIMWSTRFHQQEAEATRQMAGRAGAPVASFIRAAVLNRPLSPVVRLLTVGHEVAAPLSGELECAARQMADEIAAAGPGDRTARDRRRAPPPDA